jgi:hypothetical protein
MKFDHSIVYQNFQILYINTFFQACWQIIPLQYNLFREKKVNEISKQ